MKKIIIITLLLFLPFATMGYNITIDDTRKNTTFEKVLVSYKYSEDIQKSLYMMQECKTTKNPKWCFELINHTGWHETKFGRASSKNTFGMLGYGGTFKEQVNLFIERFNKYWYNQKCSSMVSESKYTLTQKNAWINNCERMKNNLNLK